jgi:hypothetical protein
MEASMRQIAIVGAGGFGREVLAMLRDQLARDPARASSAICFVDDAKAGLFRLLGTGRARAQADANVDAGIAEAHRVGVALAAEADDGNDATLDDGQIGIAVVEQLGHGGTPLDFGSC